MLNKLNKYMLNKKSTSDEIIDALDSIGAKETILHSEYEKDCSIHDMCMKYKDEVRMFPIYDKNGKIQYAINIYVAYHWNEQTWPRLIDFKKRCKEELLCELLVSDFEMWQTTSINYHFKYIEKGKLNTIWKICNRYKIHLKYLIYTTNGVMALIKEDIYDELTKKQYRGCYKLRKYINKKLNTSLEIFTYYCNDNLTQVKYDNYFENKS